MGCTKALERTNRLLEIAKEGRAIPSVVAYSRSLLPFLVVLLQERSERVKILDFGGGLGFTYIPVIYGCIEQSIDYHEAKKICELGRHIFKNDPRIHFYTSLPKDLERVDIIHLGSLLQYIDDYKSLINTLTRYEPQYLLFTDLIAGDIPSYVTVQNYYGSKIPYRFFNINEIIEVMASVDFRLIFKSTYIGTYLGKEQEVSQNNFHEEYRLGNTCILLFTRRNR
ncbi:TPA: hypothetical protein DCX15_02300 [bacterium]|nr:hypothetical protein [bacterium]